MLTPPQAKSRLYKLLALLSALILWPALAVLLTSIMVTVGFDQILLLVLTFTVIALGLLIWFIVELWMVAPEAKTTPWSAFWVLVPFYGLFIVAMLFLEPLKYSADGKPIATQLPLTWSLIKESFSHYFKNFNTLIKPSIFFLYISPVMGISSAITFFNDYWMFAHVVIAIASIFATLWISVSIFYAVIQTLNGHTDLKDSVAFTNKKYWSYLFITLLIILITSAPFLIIILGVGGAVMGVAFATGLATADPSGINQILGTLAPLLVIGGIIAFISIIASWVWMIYKSIQYSQSIILMLDTDKKGMDALRESASLIKNRWWGVVWKNQMWGLIIAAISMSVSMFLGGFSGLLLIVLHGNPAGQAANALFTSIATGLIQTFTMPLTLTFSYKLYLALKNTRNK